MINGSVKRADKVIVQTEWMRDAVIKRTGIDADKVVKILPDIDVPTLNNTVIHNDVIKRFFYPAGEILYKNHACILEAVGILKERGLSDFEVAFTLKKGDIPGLDRYPEHEQVKYLGRIGRDEVFRRYINEILVFPSYIETFGYPPAEARAVGGRILASDCPFCHEVLDGYDRVKYFDPFKPEELADLMEGVISGKDGFAEDKSVKAAVNEEAHSSWEQVFETLINTAKAG
jgi:glycosyltransferase involved in cell wall biosynthesis